MAPQRTRRVARRVLAACLAIASAAVVALVASGARGAGDRTRSLGAPREFTSTTGQVQSAAPPDLLQEFAAAPRRAQECEAQASLSIIGGILGDEWCDGACDRACCTKFDSSGGVVLYFFVVIYTFLGLAIICDDYFCESLEKISEALDLSDDVAGATFMAAGSSAPELFTAVVTILITNSSEGLGTIVGSAVFNIMVIVGVTAISAGQTLKIWWYPLARDCVVYVISIIMMAFVVSDKVVELWESILLTLSYGGYIALMVYNSKITDWIENRNKVTPKPINNRRASVELKETPTSGDPMADIKAAALKLAAMAEANGGGAPASALSISNGGTSQKKKLPAIDAVKNAQVSPEKPRAASEGQESLASSTASASHVTAGVAGTGARPGSPSTTGLASLLGGGSKAAAKPEEDEKKKDEEKGAEHKRGMNPLLKSSNRATHNKKKAAERKEERDKMHRRVQTVIVVHRAKNVFMKNIKARRAAAAAAAAAGGGAKPAVAAVAPAPKKEEKKPEPEEEDEPMSVPDRILWFFSLPYEFAFKFTVIDCREEKWEKWYMATFTSSILWIGLLSFVMVDFAARAGCVLKVPAIVMGLIVIAAGTSVPDALSSILVAKNGQGDMAVANVLGSNVFNIFLGLGLPWFIKSCIDGFEDIILPANEEILIPVIILLAYVVLFVCVIAGMGWKLNKTIGYIFCSSHLLFIAWNLLTMLDDPVIKLT